MRTWSNFLQQYRPDLFKNTDWEHAEFRDSTPRELLPIGEVWQFERFRTDSPPLAKLITPSPVFAQPKAVIELLQDENQIELAKTGGFAKFDIRKLKEEELKELIAYLGLETVTRRLIALARSTPHPTSHLPHPQQYHHHYPRKPSYHRDHLHYHHHYPRKPSYHRDHHPHRNKGARATAHGQPRV